MEFLRVSNKNQKEHMKSQGNVLMRACVHRSVRACIVRKENLFQFCLLVCMSTFTKVYDKKLNEKKNRRKNIKIKSNVNIKIKSITLKRSNGIYVMVVNVQFVL